MATPVTIQIKDNAVIPAPVVNVGVWVLDPSTYEVLTQGITDNTGTVGFMLEDGTYEVRFYKRGYGFTNPTTLVVDHLLQNTFPVTFRDLTTLPPSTNPNCCRCTGEFVDLRDVGTVGRTVTIHSDSDVLRKNPNVVDGRKVVGSSVFGYTSAGKVSFDLVRGGTYWVTVSGEEDTVWKIVVPNRDSVNLIDLMHPAPVAVEWDPTMAPGNAVSVPVGQAVSIPATVLFTDFQDRSAEIQNWIQYTVDPTQTFARVSFDPLTGGLQIEGVTPGTFLVTPTLAPGLVSRTPTSLVGAQVLTVTVTP